MEFSINLFEVFHEKPFFFQQKLDENPTSPTSVQTRRSRVMHVEDKTKAFRQVVRKDQIDRLQEVRKAPEQWTNQQNVNARRRAMNPMRRNLELKSKTFNMLNKALKATKTSDKKSFTASDKKALKAF